METRAPSVVAVVVASEPDGYLERTLVSLREQDYAELSILVLVGRGGKAAAARVAEAAPGAFVAMLEEDRGFGAAVNEAMGKIEGASFFLLCHDDVVLDSDAVHLLVEEAFRSNAGIVTPKVVDIDDRSVLLHVGQSVDRFGTVIERVQPGEFDQGQHDAVRDVFVAPGGVTLVRDDLLRQLGGFDERYVAMGDDLEFCWRAHLVGARIVCAPQARVAHAERLASGDRVLATPAGEDGPPSLSRLRRRNEIRTLLTCWGIAQRIWTIALLLVLNAAEIVVALVGQDSERAVDIRESWRSWWRERKVERATRRAAASQRTTSDRTIRSLQQRGATRARQFLVVMLNQGFHVARGEAENEIDDEDVPELTASFGGAFSDDEGFDELDDLGRRAGRRGSRRRLASTRSIFGLGGVVAIVYLIGSRNLIGQRLPLLGQLVPMGSWSAVWHQAFASWQPAGLGNGAPGHPGYLSLGLLGTLTFGQMGATIRLILLLAIPLGAWGTSRLLTPVASSRARLLAAAAFAGLALGPDIIAAGDVGAAAALGATPFLIRRLLAMASVVPFEQPFGEPAARGAKGWRASRQGQIAGLSLLLAFVGALAPAFLIVALLAVFGIAAASAAAGGARPLSGLRGSLLAVGIAVILLAPLTIQAVLAGGGGLAIFGTAGAPWSQPGLGGLLRFAVGPNVSGPLSWLLPAAAVVPLIVARAGRFSLTSRLAGIAIMAYALSLLASRGGVGPFAPDLLVVLAPAATAVAAMVGLGLAAFEIDLPGFGFGWRQVAVLVGVAAALLGLIPLVADSVNGRWKMPSNGYADTLRYLDTHAQAQHRILWLGDPRAVPGGSWSIEPGLAWSTSSGGLPGLANMLAPAQATAGEAVTGPLALALDHETVRLGHLLAPTGVTDIVVVTSTAPTLPGVQRPQVLQPPGNLIPALERQNDLVEVPGAGGTIVFETTSSVPSVAVRNVPVTQAASPTTPGATAGWRRLKGAEMTGPTGSGARSGFAGFAPSSDFQITSNGAVVATQSMFSWAQTGGISPGTLSVTLNALPLNGLLAAATLGSWIVLSLWLIGRHRWLDWWWRPRRARRRRQRAIGDEQADEEVAS